MEFCENCGSRLEPSVLKSGRQQLLMLVCNKCGKKKRDIEKSEFKIVKVIKHNPKQMVAVIGEEESKLNTMPTVKVECPKCKNRLAFVWLVQTRGSDESSTQFMRCTRCNHTFREMS